MHTPASSQTCIATANATLSTSNSVNVGGSIDTDYGANCAAIYRVSTNGTSPTTTGLIAGCAGKKFIDTGLAGDGSTAPTTNTTDLIPTSAALPGCNIMADYLTGPDAPNCSPDATNQENRETFGSPGGINDGVWTKLNFGSATAAFNAGTISITTDTTASVNLEGLAETTALPGTPFTYEVYVNSMAMTQFGGCFVGLRESSTGKMSTIGIANNALINGGTSIGLVMQAHNWTSFTAQASLAFLPNRNDGYYFRIQDTGTNIITSFSPTGDGVNYQQLASTPVSTAFTTAPNQFIIGAGSATTAGKCSFDFSPRRTQ